MHKLGFNFHLLWQGSLVSQLGTHAFNIARVYWLVDTLNEGFYVGALLTVCSLTIALFSPIGGIYADKYNRRNILIYSDLVSGISMLALAVIMFTSLSIEVKTVALFISSIIVSLSTCFFNPACQSIIPEIVNKDNLVSANSRISQTFHIGQVFGQGLGGVILAFVNIPLLILLNAISFIVSAISERFIKYKYLSTSNHKTKIASTRNHKTLGVAKRDILQAFDCVRNNHLIKYLITYLSLDSFLLMPIFVLLPFLAKDFYEGGSTTYGVLVGSFSVGMIFGYSIAHRAKPYIKKHKTLFPTLLILRGLFMAILGSIGVEYIGVLSLFALGVSAAIICSYIRSYIQLSVDTQNMGKVFGLISGLSNIMVPIAFALSGISISTNIVEARDLILIIGVLSVLLGLWVVSRKNIINDLINII